MQKKDKLINFRNSKNLSQEKMANHLGYSFSLYRKIEAGHRNPSYNFLESFHSKFPDVNITYLFFD